jgi:hypothetical protein
METEGINLPPSDWTPEAISAHFADRRHVDGQGAGGRVPAGPEIYRAGRGEGGREALKSFRGDAKHRTRNLEIPGPREDACPGMTLFLAVGESGLHSRYVANF